MKGCKPFIFDRIHRLGRWDGTVFRSKAQKNHFRSLAKQDDSVHPAWSVSKTCFFDMLKSKARLFSPCICQFFPAAPCA